MSVVPEGTNPLLQIAIDLVENVQDVGEDVIEKAKAFVKDPGDQEAAGEFGIALVGAKDEVIAHLTGAGVTALGQLMTNEHVNKALTKVFGNFLMKGMGLGGPSQKKPKPKPEPPKQPTSCWPQAPSNNPGDFPIGIPEDIGQTEQPDGSIGWHLPEEESTGRHSKPEPADEDDAQIYCGGDYIDEDNPDTVEMDPSELRDDDANGLAQNSLLDNVLNGGIDKVGRALFEAKADPKTAGMRVLGHVLEALSDNK